MAKRREPARVPADEGEPPEPWLTAKQAELDATPGSMRVYLLVSEEGAELIANGILPRYVIEQARSALEWCCVEARKPFHEQTP